MKLNKFKIDFRKNGIMYVVYCLIGLMFLSGLTQMPVSKRYSIDVIPFLGWTSDFFITNYVHYATGLILLVIASYFSTNFIINYKKSYTLTQTGYAIFIMSGIIVLTGILKSLSTLINGFFYENVLIVANILHISTGMLFVIVLPFLLYKEKKFMVRREV